MSIREDAAKLLEKAREEAKKSAAEKQAKVKSAEELAERLETLNGEKNAIDEIVDANIKAEREKGKQAKDEVDQEIKSLVSKNSKFAEEALQLMNRATAATSNVRKVSLKGVGRGLGWLRDAANQIGKEIQEGMDR